MLHFWKVNLAHDLPSQIAIIESRDSAHIEDTLLETRQSYEVVQTEGKKRWLILRKQSITTPTSILDSIKSKESAHI